MQLDNTVGQKAMFWVFATIFLVPGAILLGFAARHLMRAQQSKSWPTVDVTILRAEVSEDEGSSYRPEVRFAYSIDGKAYETDRIWVGWPLSAEKKWAEGVVARYPTGSHFRAAVDPREPSFCVLEPGIHGLHFGSIALASVSVAVGIYALLIAIGWARFR